MADGTVVDLRLNPTLRAPFIARRMVSSLITSGPRLRAIDASLLAGEVTTLVLGNESVIGLVLTESGRSIRVTVKVESGPITAPDTIVKTLLDRVADRWASSANEIWFEIDLIKRHDLSGLPDNELFALMPDDLDARNELFERYAPFASSLSRRFRSRDQRTDDLEQVALLGLVHALERFDPAVGVKFTTFGGRWISGVLKRHLRDHAWTIRVPRSLKENALELTRTRTELSQQLGREPLFDELATALGYSSKDLQEAMLAGDTYSLTSLDSPAGGGDGGDGDSIGGLIGLDDPDLAIAEEWPAVEAVLDRLSDREQQILYLRFFEDLTQSEIAPIVGVSQVHVSRMLKQSLEKVRSMLEEPGGD